MRATTLCEWPTGAATKSRAVAYYRAGGRGGRLGAIDIYKNFDAVLLVLLDENFNATTIYEAERADVVEALTKPGSRARNERNAMSISMFKRIGWKVWDREI